MTSGLLDLPGSRTDQGAPRLQKVNVWFNKFNIVIDILKVSSYYYYWQKVGIKMRREVIGRCPVCSEALEVTELTCPECNTTISGTFKMCKFCSLTEEQKHFAEVFIKNRGNIREVERELGISYPTVRGRLEALIRALGYPVNSEPDHSDEQENAEKRKQILDRLAQGEITASEAARLLRNLRNG